MKKWPFIVLEEITEKIGSGATPTGGNSAYQLTGIPLIRSMNVHDYHFKDDELAFINEKQAQALQNVKLFENDVLLNITGASVGRVCLLPPQYSGGRVNQHVSIIRSKQNKLHPNYLLHCLLSPQIKNSLLASAGAGATREAITKQAIQELKIPLPPLEEQKRIAAILDQANVLRRLRQRSIDRLNSLGQAIFYQMCPTSNNEADSYLGEFLQEIQIGPFGSLLHKSDYVEDGTPLINPMHIINAQIQVTSAAGGR